MNVLLTGERQTGKTTVCKRVADLARELGYDPAGLLSPARLGKDSLPVAYHALLVSDGEERPLAWANGDLGGALSLSKGGPRTDRYSFDAGELSFCIRPGEFMLVTGPSGSGKSTLLRALVGLIPHASLARMEGRVVVDGLDTREHPLPVLAGHVGMVFQNPATQLFCLGVEEVAFGPHNLGLPPEEVARRVEWALAAAGLEHLRGRQVNTLSDGEKQRLAIAAVLAMSPRIIILDEPTSNLDMAGTRQVLATLESL